MLSCMQIMGDKKRKNNFSVYERTLLVCLVKQHSIISSSQKDGRTNQKKEAAWSEILAEFTKDENATMRTVKELKACFLNMTQRAKVKDSKQKQEIRKTGGGPAPSCLSPISEGIREMIPQIFNPIDCNDDDALEKSACELLPDFNDGNALKKSACELLPDSNKHAIEETNLTPCDTVKATSSKGKVRGIFNIESVTNNSNSMHKLRTDFMKKEHNLRMLYMRQEHAWKLERHKLKLKIYEHKLRKYENKGEFIQSVDFDVMEFASEQLTDICSM